MERDARCPFAPPPQMLEMNEAKPLSRVRIWNGSTPWLITGHEVARALVRRPPGQRRRPARRLPALERAHALHRQQAAAVGVHLRRRGAHPVPPDAVQAVHLQARRGAAVGHPGGHRRVHRRDPGGPAARRHGRQARAAGAHQGDQRHARRALRRPRVLPAPRERRPGPLRLGGRRPEGGDEPPQVPDQPRRGEDGQPVRGRGVRPRRTGHRRRDQREGSRAAGHRPADRRARDHRQHDRHRRACPARKPGTGCAASRFRRSQVHRQRGRRADALPVDHPERPAPGRHRGHRDRRRDHPRRRGHHHRPRARRTGTAPPIPNPTSSTSPATPVSNSASATAVTSASGSSSRAPNCRSCSRRCCAAFRR